MAPAHTVTLNYTNNNSEIITDVMQVPYGILYS